MDNLKLKKKETLITPDIRLDGKTVMHSSIDIVNCSDSEAIHKNFIPKKPVPGTKVSITYTYRQAGWEHTEVELWNAT